MYRLDSFRLRTLRSGEMLEKQNETTDYPHKVKRDDIHRLHCSILGQVQLLAFCSRSFDLNDPHTRAAANFKPRAALRSSVFDQE
jgi:hypothetical protein